MSYLRLMMISLAGLTVLGSLCGCRPSASDKQPSSPPAALETTAAGGASASEISSGDPWFRDVTDAYGLDFLHQAGPVGDYFFPQIMIGGGAFLDFDRDGDLDLYLVNGNLSAGDDRDQGISNHLYRLDDDRYVDVTEGSGVGDTGYGMGAAVADVNNDGWSDLYVSNYGADRLYVNQGNGTFVDVTQTAGIDNRRWAASATFIDYDRDGRLDLYVTNYVDYFSHRRCTTLRDQPDYCSPEVFAFASDKLYHNVSPAGATADQVRFEDVSLDSRIALVQGPGLGVTVGDFNQDQWPDLYVANDGSANYLWINQHDGTFVDEAILRGVAYDAQGRSQAGMGIATAFFNDDLIPDLLVTHLDGESNAFYLSSDEYAFRETAGLSALRSASFPYTGFGVVWLDVEHDGDLDLAVANGRVTRPKTTNMISPARLARPSPEVLAEYWSAYGEPNQLFQNSGDGRFAVRNVTDETFSDRHDVSRALVAGDVDNDGDQDLLVVNVAQRARLYLNEAPKQGHWIGLRVVDPNLGGRDACGARVICRAGNRRWMATVNPGSSYLASHDPRIHFGLGGVETLDEITVTWPDGPAETFSIDGVDQYVTLRRGEGQLR